MKTILLPLLCLPFVVACSVEDITQPSPALCTQVENSKIDSNTTGFRNVTLVTQGANQIIGYQNQGFLVKHSHCTAAQKEVTGTSLKYSWFELGVAKEQSGIHSITYYSNRFGEASSIATRLERSGHWQQQYVENGKVTRQIWTEQSPFVSIDTQKNYDGNDQQKVVMNTGGISKTKEYNSNNAQYDCTYNDGGSITYDAGCLNEPANDLTILGYTADADFYLRALLNQTIGYELDYEQLDQEIANYF